MYVYVVLIFIKILMSWIPNIPYTASSARSSSSSTMSSTRI